MYQGSITDIKGIKVGCAQNYEKVTGCTAVVFDNLCTAGVDVRGGGPGTINTDILNPQQTAASRTASFFQAAAP